MGGCYAGSRVSTLFFATKFDPFATQCNPYLDGRTNNNADDYMADGPI